MRSYILCSISDQRASIEVKATHIGASNRAKGVFSPHSANFVFESLSGLYSDLRLFEAALAEVKKWRKVRAHTGTGRRGSTEAQKQQQRRCSVGGDLRHARRLFHAAFGKSQKAAGEQC